MRGEEVQILGIFDELGDGQHTICLPGTHSKWVSVDDRKIDAFRTYMTGEVFALKAGTMYTLDRHDPHRLDATTDMRIVCVFSPALVGRETHDKDGSYPILED